MENQFDPSKYNVVPFQKRIEKPWGYEIIYTPDTALAVGKIIHVNAGKRLSLQYHDEKIETLCLIEGKAKITLLGKDGATVELPMEFGKGYFVQKGQTHRVAAITDIVFVESSTPEVGNTFRIEDDNNRANETEIIRKTQNRGWQ